MRVIPPLTITDAMLTSSTAAEAGPGEVLWSASTLYAEGDQVYLGSPSTTVTISNGSPGVITWTANGLEVGTPVVFTSTGTLPAGLTSGTVYYVKRRLTVNTFTVSATLGGPAVNTTSAGSGTHTGTAQVHRIFEMLLVAATATFTVTIAAPGVFTQVAHGYTAGTPLVFTTTGALPTGLTVGTTYYVISAGLTLDAYQVSTMLGGSAVTTSGTQSGVHTAGLASTYNKPPLLNTSTWGDIGPTNKWAMFDLLRNTATSVATPLTAVVTPGTRIDSGAWLDLVGTSLTVSATSVIGGGTVYSPAAFDLTTRDVGNWYEYFFKAFTYKTAVAVFDIPPYSDIVITASVAGAAGSTVSCGAMVIGMNEGIGTVESNAESDVLNFSEVTRDDFGGAEMVQRRNVPKTTQRIFFDKADTNNIRNLRDALNAVPAVWCAIDDSDDEWFEALLILGFYRRFSLDLALPEYGWATLELEEI